MHNIKINYTDFSFVDTKDIFEVLKTVSRKSMREVFTSQNSHVFYMVYYDLNWNTNKSIIR